MSDYFWMVWVGAIFCVCMAWGIGANDVANFFATPVGARSIKLKNAMIIAFIFEFIGAFGLGSTVTDTIRKKITDYDLYKQESDLLLLGMFSSLIAASVWVYYATKYSLPISSTHSIVGAIVGFVLVSKGSKGVHWDIVSNIIIFWIATPLMGLVVCLFLWLPTRHLLLRREDSYKITLFIYPLFVFIVIFVMALFLLLQGFNRITKLKEVNKGYIVLISIGIGLFTAFLAYLLVKFNVVSKYVERNTGTSIKVANNSTYNVNQDNNINNNNKENDNDNEVNNNINNNNNNNNNDKNDQELAQLRSVSNIDIDENDNNNNNNDIDIHVFNNKKAEDEDEDNNNKINTTKDDKNSNHVDDSNNNNFVYRLILRFYKTYIDVDIFENMDKTETDLEKYGEKFDPKTERTFSWLQVLSAAFGIFAHGSNDVANAIAPFTAILSLYNDPSITKKVTIPLWVLAIGGLGMSIGCVTYGYNVIRCLGIRLASMSASRGYFIQISSALVIIIASHFGFPASTTHAQVGSTVAVGISEKVLNGHNSNKDKLEWSKVLNWRLLIQVFIGWVATLIIAGSTSALIYSILAYSPCA